MRSPIKIVPFSLVLATLLPRLGRGEDMISYKFQSWQEDDGRIRVDAHYALVEKSLTVATKMKLTGVIDAIAGATPSGQPPPAGSSQVPLSRLVDRRKAWTSELSHQFTGLNVALGYAQSRESDYISKGWSVNTLWDFNQKNTTLLLGYARTDDDITARFLPRAQTKNGDDIIVGITQLLSPRATVTVNLTNGKSDGYLSDPYKLIQKNTEVFPGLFLPLTFPENRPRSREKWVLFTSANVAFDKAKGAMDASYRYYHDEWGSDSHTLALEWYQSFGERFIVRPAIRFYNQTAADFYRISLDGSSIVPTSPASGRAPFYSADYRLSKLDSVNLGIKFIWTAVPERLLLDAAYERYNMRGRDGVTSPSAYPDADVFTFGLRWTW